MTTRRFEEEFSEPPSTIRVNTVWISKDRVPLKKDTLELFACNATFPYIIEAIFMWSFICLSLWWLDSTCGSWSEDQQKMILFLFILPGSVASAWTIRRAVQWFTTRLITG